MSSSNNENISQIYQVLFSTEASPQDFDQAFVKVLLCEPIYNEILSHVKNKSTDDIIMLATNYIKRCVNHLSSDDINTSYNSYHNLYCIICALNQAVDDSDCLKYISKLLYDPMIFNKINYFGVNRLNDLNNKKILFVLITHNLLTSKHLISYNKPTQYFPLSSIIHVLNLQKDNLMNANFLSIVDSFNIFTVIDPDIVTTLITDFNNLDNLAVLLKILTYLLRREIENFDETYKNFIDPGVLENIKTKIGYQESNYPCINCQIIPSLFNLIKVIITDRQLAAIFIGCKIYESSNGSKLLIHRMDSYHLLELIFEYFSAIVFSLLYSTKAEPCRMDLTTALQFSINLLNSILTNETLVEYLCTHPPSRPLKHYFHLNLIYKPSIGDVKVETSLFIGHILGCILILLEPGKIDQNSPLVHNGFLTLIYHLLSIVVKHNITIDYPWVELFKRIVSLCLLIGTLINAEFKPEFLSVFKKIFCLINIFLCDAGDILNDPIHYDVFFLELARNYADFTLIFINIKTFAEEPEYKKEALDLLAHGSNIKRIVGYFHTTIYAKNTPSLSEPQIITIISNSLQNIYLNKFTDMDSIFLISKTNFDENLIQSIFLSSLNMTYQLICC